VGGRWLTEGRLLIHTIENMMVLPFREIFWMRFVFTLYFTQGGYRYKDNKDDSFLGLSLSSLMVDDVVIYRDAKIMEGTSSE
jgi:hypothetical protein